MKYNSDGTQAKLVGNPVKHEIPVVGDLVISGYSDSHDTKSLRIVTGEKEFVVGDHVASPSVTFHHSPKIPGARLRYISHTQDKTTKAVVFKFHWEVAEEDSPVGATEDADNRVNPAKEGGLARLQDRGLQ